MNRKVLFFMFSSLFFLTGCSQGNEEPAAPEISSEENVRAESWREDQLLAGQQVYQAACASCHDQGNEGAPMIGDRAAWSDRSDLWTAVLSTHAKAGYLEMPEKGGHSELSADEVLAAVEYMLQQTFPERPRD